MNISTICMHNKTRIKRNILTIKKIHWEVGRAKDLSVPLYCLYSQIVVYAARHRVRVFIFIFISYKTNTPIPMPARFKAQV